MGIVQFKVEAAAFFAAFTDEFMKLYMLSAAWLCQDRRLRMRAKNLNPGGGFLRYGGCDK